MFDLKNLGNLGNLGDLLGKAQEMRQQMEKFQAELARKQVTAEAGGGMVQATVNGRMELVKLHIEREKMDPNDLELLEDVIVAAVRGAQTRAAEMMKQEMQKQAADMGLPPGIL